MLKMWNKKRKLIVDIETDSLDATVIHVAVTKDIDTKEIFKYGPDKLNDAIDRLKNANLLIGHNVIAYDIPVIKKLLKKVWAYIETSDG